MRSSKSVNSSGSSAASAGASKTTVVQSSSAILTTKERPCLNADEMTDELYTSRGDHDVSYFDSKQNS